MRINTLPILGAACVLGLVAVGPVKAAPGTHGVQRAQQVFGAHRAQPVQGAKGLSRAHGQYGQPVARSRHGARAGRRPIVDEDQSFLDPGKDSSQPRQDLYVMEQIYMHQDPIRANQRGLYFNEWAEQRFMDQWGPNSPFPVEPGIPVTPGYFR